MEFNIIECIKEVGFPIAAFVMIFWFMCRKMDKLDNSIKENTDSTIELGTSIKNHLRHTIDDLKGSIDENTQATRELKDEVKKKQ